MPTKNVNIAISGAHGGRTIDFRRLAGKGVNLLGRAEACENGSPFLDAADAYAISQRLDGPDEPWSRAIELDSPIVTDPILELCWQIYQRHCYGPPPMMRKRVTGKARCCYQEPVMQELRMADEEKAHRFDLLPVIVLVWLVILMLLGWWVYPKLQHYMAEQDCIATGRTNCQ
jgi:hypothetical protein